MYIRTLDVSQIDSVGSQGQFGSGWADYIARDLKLACFSGWKSMADTSRHPLGDLKNSFNITRNSWRVLRSGGFELLSIG